MKSKALRFLTIIIVVTVVAGIIVLAIGLISKWQTEIQFSNGYFYGGGVLLVIGLVNAMGARSDDRVGGMADGRISTQERESSYHLISEDIAKANNRMIYMGVSGLLLWVVAALVPLMMK
ncbi:MAG: hypothetical protein CVU43_14010 [Chloroflexi bacterium HGW-Chloroflexi-5]|jgi:uncharacterized membrane protein YiaA|nr:MAG: hypothetical protein CVU43_14010 [Chloroflexi bacterium HGW-Chloroflexi-5]